jgi:hypothetical protein
MPMTIPANSWVGMIGKRFATKASRRGLYPTDEFALQIGAISGVENLDRTLSLVPILGPSPPMFRAADIAGHGHNGSAIVDAGFVHVGL